MYTYFVLLIGQMAESLQGESILTQWEEEVSSNFSKKIETSNVYNIILKVRMYFLFFHFNV